VKDGGLLARISDAEITTAGLLVLLPGVALVNRPPRTFRGLNTVPSIRARVTDLSEAGFTEQLSADNETGDSYGEYHDNLKKSHSEINDWCEFIHGFMLW